MAGRSKFYTHHTIVLAPVKVVAEFHSSTSVLRRLTPPPIFVQIRTQQPLGEGATSDFIMWMGPIPIPWVAEHCNVDAVTGFTDIQVRGPFARWRHRHRFQATGDQVTQIVDEIEAEYGEGLWSGIISRLMWFGLPLMFAYRSWVIRRELARANNG